MIGSRRICGRLAVRQGLACIQLRFVYPQPQHSTLRMSRPYSGCCAGGLPLCLCIPQVGLPLLTIWAAIVGTEIMRFVRWRRDYERSIARLIRISQDGEIRARWASVESVVWTERMLATLETGIEGGKWFRLIDKVWSPKGPGCGTIITMAKCLLQRGGLVLLKTSECCGLPIFLKANHQLRAECQKLACSVRREGRPHPSSLTPIKVS